MRILQINAVYARLSTGRTTKEMHEYFMSHGIDSYVASPMLDELTNNGFQIGDERDHKIHGLLSRITGRQGYFSVKATKELLRWMDVIKPDVVILRNLHSNYINLLLLAEYLSNYNIATILVLHDFWFLTGGCTHFTSVHCSKWQTDCDGCPLKTSDYHSWFLKPTKRILEDRKNYLSAIKRLSIVGVSRWVADDARRSVLKNAFSIQHIYNWINLNTFCPKDRTALREKYSFSQKQFIIIGVSASWSAAKGINVFHGLADLLPEDCKIVLVGDSSSIENKHAKIQYIPRTSSIEELADMYSLADVFVNPTIQETFGKTTAEALSCGIPVVGYRGTATPELVGENEACGFLIDSLEPTAFLKKIQIIRQNTVELYSDNCRERALQMFDMETNIRQYMALICSML